MLHINMRGGAMSIIDNRSAKPEISRYMNEFNNAMSPAAGL